MPAAVNTTRRHLNAPATVFGSSKSQQVHHTRHEHDSIAFNETRIGRSCPAASGPDEETGCHLPIDTAVVLDTPALDEARSFAWLASPRLRDCVSPQVCCAPRRQTIELPLSDDPIEKLILQCDTSLNLKAPEGEGALGLLL